MSAAGGKSGFQIPSAEELHKLILREVRDYAIMVMDVDNRFRVVNRGAEEVLGYRPADLIGKSADVIFTPEDRAAGEVEKEVRSARRNGRAKDERWHLRRNGERFWGMGVTTALKDRRGRVVAYLKLLRDFTERKLIEDQTRAMNELLEQRVSQRTGELLDQQHRLRALAVESANAEQRARDSLAADLHDNLAQIMAVCLMKLGAASAAFPNAAPPPQFGEAVECAREVLRQVREMMYDLSPMVLGDGQVTSAVEWVKERMLRHGLNVTVQDDGKEKRLEADVLRIVYRAVQELLWNVVKHARVNRATVKLAVRKKLLRVTVSDRGRGFNPARTQRAGAQGGFGLFSLRERLAAARGKMTIRSSPGRGTTVTIEVPLAEAI